MSILLTLLECQFLLIILKNSVACGIVFYSLKNTWHTSKQIETSLKLVVGRDSFFIKYLKSHRIYHLLLNDNFLLKSEIVLEYVTYFVYLNSSSTQMIAMMMENSPIQTILLPLISLCSDRYARSLTGFCHMIQNDWLTYPISALKPHDRSKIKNRLSAPFLIFLNCMYQVIWFSKWVKNFFFINKT